MTERIGITSTVPVEVIYASGRSAVDINNLFITGNNPLKFVQTAEEAGFPRNTCAWIKGIYSALKEAGISRVVAVTQGDCSNTISLSEKLSADGVEIIPFSYPYGGDRDYLEREINKLIRVFKTDWKTVADTKKKLDKIRRKIWKIDELTWKEGKVKGFENHIWQVSASDFRGDPEKFEKEAGLFYKEAVSRKNSFCSDDVKLGVIGVPPIVSGLYDYVEESGGRIVFNEVQRQFTMPGSSSNILDQYLNYTYPYGIAKKLKDIKKEIARRKINGLIQYVQSFCHHQIEADIYKGNLDIPIIQIECDKPGILEGKDKTRIETFINSLKTARGQTANHERGKTAISVSKTQMQNVCCGIDVGSRYTKIVFMQERKILKELLFDTIDFYRSYGKNSGGDLKVNISGFGILPDAVISTGYGRKNIDFTCEGEKVTEIEAHCKGVVHLSGQDNFTLVDIGGQDVKIIDVKDGRAANFAVNDKCAAGTGRYLENMSAILGVNIEALGVYYEEPLCFNSTCAVFSETELIGKIADGIPFDRLCASVNYSAYLKLKPSLLKIWTGGPIVVSGGGSKNSGIKYFMEKEFRTDIVKIKHAQFAGAIGCALIGADND